MTCQGHGHAPQDTRSTIPAPPLTHAGGLADRILFTTSCALAAGPCTCTRGRMARGSGPPGVVCPGGTGGVRRGQTQGGSDGALATGEHHLQGAARHACTQEGMRLIESASWAHIRLMQQQTRTIANARQRHPSDPGCAVPWGAGHRQLPAGKTGMHTCREMEWSKLQVQLATGAGRWRGTPQAGERRQQAHSKPWHKNRFPALREAWASRAARPAASWVAAPRPPAPSRHRWRCRRVAVCTSAHSGAVGGTTHWKPGLRTWGGRVTGSACGGFNSGQSQQAMHSSCRTPPPARDRRHGCKQDERRSC